MKTPGFRRERTIVIHMLTPEIRAVVFDAGGTLIFPNPSAAVTYARVGQRHGSRLAPEVIGPRFAAAFARQERLDAGLGHRTDEAREERRWRGIVAEVLDDLADIEPCFQELYRHYALPQAWRCPDDAGLVLRALAKRGLVLALASNYDHRLYPVVAGLSELQPLARVVLSAEVGWRKPAREFFAAVCEATDCDAREVLFVGDDPDNDYAGARAAGMQAVLYDPHGRYGRSFTRIASFRELLPEGR
jgi:putative hydrolase of the HAD superfamily